MMAGMTPKIKSDLSYLYDLDEFKSLKKFCEIKRDKTAVQLLNLDMSAQGVEKTVAFLQGQAKALEWLFLELKALHKKEMAKEFPKTKN